MLFLQICHFLLNIIDNMRCHFLHPEILALLIQWRNVCFYAFLVKTCSRCRNHGVSLIGSFFLISYCLINSGVKNDTFSHKFDDRHKLKENFHDADPKLRDLHKLTRIFYLCIDKQIHMSST